MLRALSPLTAETGFPPKVLGLLQMSQTNGIHILALPPHTLDESVNDMVSYFDPTTKSAQIKVSLQEAIQREK